jgi:hypothetical protein
VKATGYAGLASSLAGLATTTGTIVAASETGDSYGEGIETWAPVDGLSDLAASVGPATTGIAFVNHGGLVVSEADQIKVILFSYHPEVVPETHRWRWNDQDWRITASYPSQIGEVTELRCEHVLPSEASDDAEPPVEEVP